MAKKKASKTKAKTTTKAAPKPNKPAKLAVSKTSSVKAPPKKAAPKVESSKSKHVESSPTKESAPIQPGKLGQKRICIKCSAKFYDFEKNPIICPKCKAKMTPDDFLSFIPKAEPKKPKEKGPAEAMLQNDDSESDSPADAFESTEDLADDGDDVVEDLDVDDDKEDENY